jgi:hypothetical protein
MMQPYQFRKAAQPWLLEDVQFAVEIIPFRQQKLTGVRVEPKAEKNDRDVLSSDDVTEADG